MSLDLHLLGKDMISDFFSGLAHIGSLSHHALISDDSHSEVVN